MFKFLTRIAIVGLVAFGLSTKSQAALTLSLDPTDLGPGPPGVFNVDVFISWDGNGSNALSSISFDVTPDAPVTLSVPGATPNPFGFDLPSTVPPTVGFTNFTSSAARDVVIPNGTSVLTTISLDASTAPDGNYNIGITLVQATGAAFADVAGDFTAVSGGTLIVGVPEPSSLALVGSLVGGVCFHRRRRSA